MPDPLHERLQASLGDAFAIQRELGGGGMARVFVAYERALGRRVVVKVLSPSLAEGISAERFAREIRLAAQLQDPHIVPVLTAGSTADGLSFYTMPFVEGESLRVRLTTGAVPLSDAMTILRDVAAALEYAHAHGIVHRDIKPENILLSGRTAVVTDFGIAKALVAAKTAEVGAHMDDAADPGLTQLGTTIGTPAYMAPEQAAGDAIDARSDLYAWGVLAYEMVSGAHPFAGCTTAREFITAHLGTTPDPLPVRASGAPADFAALVTRCLAKAPRDRPRSAAELVESLGSQREPARPGARRPAWGVPRRWSVGAVAAVLTLAAVTVATIVALRSESGGILTDRPATGAAVAVLPFENLGDIQDAYFADGVSDAVRGKLAALPNLSVIARTSSVQYRGRPTSPAEIGRELGVRYLLTGTVRWMKAPDGQSRVQVNPELIELAGGDGAPTIRWQQPIESPLTDVFEVQADIARRVAEALHVTFDSGDRQRLAERPTDNLEAYDLYLRAEEVTQGWAASDPRTMRRAIALYERAVALDTGFALAWARLGQARSFLYSNAQSDPQLARNARYAVERAMKLAPDLAIVHGALGQYLGAVELDRDRALEAFDRAGRIAPNNVEVLHLRTDSETAVGRTDSALAHALRAAQLDPRSPRALRTAGNLLASVRRFAEADSTFARAQSLAPDNIGILHNRVQARLSQGDLSGARALTQPSATPIPQIGIAVFLSRYSDLYWPLDSSQTALLLRSRPDDFDGDVGDWALALAQVLYARGDVSRAREYADSARAAYQAAVRANPGDAGKRALLGLSLAYQGRYEDAVREARSAVELVPLERDRSGAYVALQLARVYALMGDPERSVETLEPLLRIPWYFTPAWLRIDPSFAPLRGYPRFERLIRRE